MGYLPHYCIAPCFFLMMSRRLVYISTWKDCLILFSSCVIFHCTSVVGKNCERLCCGHKGLLTELSSVLFQVICTFLVFELFYITLNCRKLMVMQMILVHRNTNGFCPVECNGVLSWGY